MHRSRASRLVAALAAAVLLAGGQTAVSSAATPATPLAASAPEVLNGEATQYAVHSDSYGFPYFVGIEQATFRVVPWSAVNGKAALETASGEPRIRFTPNGRFTGIGSYRWEATDRRGTVVALGQVRVRMIPLHTHLYGMSITPGSQVMTRASGTRIDMRMNHGIDSVGILGSVLTLTIDGVKIDARRADATGRLTLRVPPGTLTPGQHHLLVRYAPTGWALGASRGALFTVAG